MQYEKDKKYRVIKDGAQLYGMKPTAPYCQTGWRKKLEVGEVITCAGCSMTFGDGIAALKWNDENGEWLANDCMFKPVKGNELWGMQEPADGFLEEVQ